MRANAAIPRDITAKRARVSSPVLPVLPANTSPPLTPDLVLDTEQLSVGEAVDLLEAFVRERVTVGAAASR